MTIATPLALRWERAQQMDRSSIKDFGNGRFYVPSQSGPADYAVQLGFGDDGRLAFASCTCPDFTKPTNGMGTPELHGVRVCKHVLAACLKAQDAKNPVPTLGPEPNRQPVPHPQPAALQSNLPVAEQPVWDRETEEWVLTDSDGLHYCGPTASECIRQFHEALHYKAEHLRKNGHNGSEVCRPHPAESRPVDENRRQALSRARGIANQARPPHGPAYRLYGLCQGDVVDWPDGGLFLAVVNVLPDGLCAKGVSQTKPWATVREIRMTASTVHQRLNQGWMTKVADLRR